MRLDPGTDRAALHALVHAADVVIEASRPRALRGWGIDAEAEVARGATWLSITAAGRACDRVGFGDDVTASAGLVALDAAMNRRLAAESCHKSCHDTGRGWCNSGQTMRLTCGAALGSRTPDLRITRGIRAAW
ncbi:MAG: hypothetical protein ABS81_03270 [Pseudonocardia sp. SCN 72-86]|nr:MAG: hypothetical protein ABS81_03270 [Pseudonocardia sp. SCN 72-86]